jgi:hypothetical protein
MEAKTAKEEEKWRKFAKSIKINMSGSLEGADDPKNEEQLKILTEMLVTVLPPKHREVFVDLLNKITAALEELASQSTTTGTISKTSTKLTEPEGDPVGVRGGRRQRMKGGRLSPLAYLECLFVALIWTLSDAILFVGGGTIIAISGSVAAANYFPTYMNLALGVAAGMQVQRLVDSIFGPPPGSPESPVTREALQEAVAEQYTEERDGSPSPAFLQTSFHPPPPGTTVPVGLVDREPLTLQRIFEDQSEIIGASVHTEAETSRGIWEAHGSKVAAGIVLCIASLWLFRFIQKIRMKQLEVDTREADAAERAARLNLTAAQIQEAKEKAELAKETAELAKARRLALQTKSGADVARELAANAALVTVPPPLRPLITRGRSPGRRRAPPPSPVPPSPGDADTEGRGGRRRTRRRHRRRRSSLPTRKGRRSSFARRRAGIH